ncbi:formyl transferase [Neorhizobium sp. NPDC001467]|uniref:formyl transferase n=1 Tax=Neorhizobium sp. NPDC001467 TaxID=3390595 RepID=UPI003CFCA3DB
MTTLDNSPTVVVMTAGGANAQVMINALERHWPDLHVIQETAESKALIIRRRARRSGWLNALGQLGTMAASRLGKKAAARRSDEILQTYGQSAAVKPAIPVHRVDSLNDAACHALLSRLKPQAILTISCRLLSRSTLAACPCPVVNFHAGINPAYRGQMGGYWSLVENDAANFGATVHLVDAGTDTGCTLYEQRLTPQAGDFIATYPLLLTAASTGITIAAIDDVLKDRVKVQPIPGRSVLRFPPPIWIWAWNGLTRGVW